jgi:hypothetical protein
MEPTFSRRNKTKFLASRESVGQLFHRVEEREGRTRECEREKGERGRNTLETRCDALLDWEESDPKDTPCPTSYNLGRQICRTNLKLCCVDEVISVEEK